MFQGKDHISITVIAPDALCMTTSHMVFSLLFYLFNFGHAAGLEGSQSPDQALNPGHDKVLNPNHWTTRNSLSGDSFQTNF